MVNARWRSLDRHERRARSRRGVLVGLVVASLAVMAVDHATGGPGGDGPVGHGRDAVAGVLGPAETIADAVSRPVAAVPSWFRTTTGLRDDVAGLEQENAELRAQLAGSDLARNQLDEYRGLTRSAAELDRTLVPARVVAYGAAQSFSRTVTIDAGTTSGVRADQTVVAAEGLVGRVLRASRHTATVLLLVDPDSTVGGRLGRTMQVGFLTGRGTLGSGSRLDLDLVDDAATPKRGDVVLTWGGGDGSPYVAGVPVGTVAKVVASPRESAQRAVIEPYVDVAALDLVGVVVPEGTRRGAGSDRGVVQADGSIR